ncbi:glycoside hydrolase [Flavobacterium branchiophilum]|uniref:Beta-glucanase (GH16 family) n=1 Tax=Flavobacterium branchiophilum TaxID=55197 RepID=A0A543G6W3_9FLAO|nr:glycoside hydrolase family 16 protein [Flavobacterium branchiophilum]OXA72775.1 glycoside hydrolase [Flavobacterium branchiophilum] [Flavobacterium branchiophilum NBRC 15030 = ATCC 35035]TQM41828.1 beta-glucanase (GH16 family) [Flavobacterium branchiophilum]GEM56383.1 beta-glucanase [Flavobacterium branchiophilum NBRC 15030 = ATCC 35035]
MKIKYTIMLFIMSILFCFGCSSGSSGGENNNSTPAPTNLVINTDIVGSSTAFPNGDGTGVVNFTLTATNATSYKILIGNETINSTTGIFSYTFTNMGTSTYTVYVSAYNGTQFISGNKTLTVLKNAGILWQDEFNVDGAPDGSKWGYDIGNSGWGNNEIQYYTNRLDNSVVSNGTLKIITKKEAFGGSAYTSARLLSKGKFSFKYGRVDIKAKLPSGAGTWPALWMLGDNITTVNWPSCGEIDIMEHLGSEPNKIHGSLHSPNNYGGNANTGITTISNATTEFHIYSLVWNATEIKFLVDNVQFYALANNSTLPFNNNFFFILNTAMGGWGGTVDPNFVGTTFEIDYIRVYQ